MNATAPLPPASGTVPNYLVWSIIVTVLAFFMCCVSCLSFPAIATGIVSIVFGTKVNTLLNQGDLVGARQASKNAKLWAWISTGILIASTLFSLIWLATVGMDGYMEQIQQFQQQIESSN
ncbi:CD225/dispanin family protein [Stenotrophomonas sp.]|uniref:CD225/dispanin family protein n=1 Tax=Stenotrophomonas sp. TaxID=69392 RepID=UPI002FC8B4EA